MRKGKPPAVPARRTGRRLAGVGLVLLAAGGLVVGVRFAGDAALGRLAGRDRYRVRVADVACDPPPGVDRLTFLNEVRYVGDLPETVRSLAPADRDRLAAAFAAHPWVASVDGVDAEPGGGLRVRLTYRVPALEVKVTDGPARLVDAAGVLLPVAGRPAGIAELAGVVKPPATAAGQVWDDPTVRRAVELVQAYQPAKLEQVVAGWRLTMPDGKTLTVPR